MSKVINLKNIVLIGMSGAGKTVVGQYISNKLNMEFLDTDDIILQKTGKTIKDIFEKFGEEYFRQLESQVILENCLEGNKVISTGGGAILKDINRKALKENGILYFLKGTIETLISNIQSSPSWENHRPLLNKGSLYDNMQNMIRDRYKLYEESADYIIDIDNKSINEIGDEIIFIFKQ